MRLKIANTREEFREAVKLVQSWRVWAWRIRLIYEAAPILLILWYCGLRIVEGSGLTEGHLLVLALILVIIGLSIRSVRKETRQKDEMLSQMSGAAFLEEAGVSLALDSGATAFRPWTEFAQWKESQSIFVLRSGKTVLVLSKGGLLSSEINETKSILEKQISSPRR